MVCKKVAGLMKICILMVGLLVALCQVNAYAESNERANDSVIAYLRNEVPEVEAAYAKDSRFFAVVESSPNPGSDDFIRQQYYRIYTGYMMPTHRVVWERFAVKADLTEILWYDVTHDSYKPLSVWRGDSTVASSSGDAVSLTESERQKLNTFFSNFSEAHVPSFHKGGLSDDAMIRFGIRHNVINRRQAMVNWDNNHWGVSAEDVGAAIRKYFGTEVTDDHSISGFPYVDGYYLVVKASGEAYTFSQIDTLRNNGDGTYTAIVNVYQASSGFTGDPHATQQDWVEAYGSNQAPRRISVWQAVIQPDAINSDRYNLVEYVKVQDA